MRDYVDSCDPRAVQYDGGNPRDDLAIVTSGTIPDVGVRKCRREVLWWRMDEASAMADETNVFVDEASAL